MKHNRDKYSSDKFYQVRTVMSILSFSVDDSFLKTVFNLTDSEIQKLIIEATYAKEVVTTVDGHLFTAVGIAEDEINIFHADFTKAIYYYFCKIDIDFDKFKSVFESIDMVVPRHLIEYAQVGVEVGDYAEEAHDTDMAITIYRLTCMYALELDINTRKRVFIKSVLKLSKLEFMRGLSPDKTLELQREAVKLINQANITSEDALLFLYAGMGEHFGGVYEEGAILREKGIKYLKQFNYDSLETEALPLMVWHYYLMGDFRKTIAYYESFILAVENRQEDNEIITFAYPPVVFAYFFSGEYNSAFALAQSIHTRAIKKQDHIAENLMYSNIGRVLVYLRDEEQARKVLTDANLSGVSLGYGWGQYYALYGLAQLEERKGNFKAARDYIQEAFDVAKQHKFAAIVASPFFIETLKGLEEQGLEGFADYSYDSELNKYLNSNNVHLRGVAYRHLAERKMKEDKTSLEIITDLKQSLYYLDLAGNVNEMARAHIDLAQMYLKDGDINRASQSANHAYRYYASQDKEDFPDDLMKYIKPGSDDFDFDEELEATWLELKEIVNEERLETRLITAGCRLFNVEAAAFYATFNQKIELRMAQNIDSRFGQEDEFQRIEGIVSQVLNTGEIFTYTNDDATGGFVLGRTKPVFFMAIPFKYNDQVTAVAYYQSYYHTLDLDDDALKHIKRFTERMSETVYSAMNYNRLTESAASIESHSYYREQAKKNAFCDSMDEELSFIQEQISKIAKTNIPVLITGETGVGKEVIARSVYEQSDYKKSFIKVNCGAIPESLIESELFGYEKGSFTGASARKKGYFELAEGGTIFLDEIGELSLIAQVKLLRVLQEHELMRVGGTESVKVDFRLIAATNKRLQDEVKAGTFREDLFYRLNVVQFNIPPLRNRKKDIPNLANFFIQKYCKELNKENCVLDQNTLVEMMNYSWPGNIRELENSIQKGVLFAENGIVHLNFAETTQTNDSIMELSSAPAFDALEKHSDNQISSVAEVISFNDIRNYQDIRPLEEIEREYIENVLRICNGKVSGRNGACNALGMKRTTLISRMDKLGIKYKDN